MFVALSVFVTIALAEADIPRPVVVEGRVVDVEGQPLANVKVTLAVGLEQTERGPLSVPLRRTQYAAFTDEAGRLAVTVPHKLAVQWGSQLVLERDGYAPVFARREPRNPVRRGSPEQLAWLFGETDFVMREAVARTLQILDSEGQLLPGVSVWADAFYPSHTRYPNFDFRNIIHVTGNTLMVQDWWNLGFTVLPLDEFGGSITTDDEGRVRFPALPKDGSLCVSRLRLRPQESLFSLYGTPFPPNPLSDDFDPDDEARQRAADSYFPLGTDDDGEIVFQSWLASRPVWFEAPEEVAMLKLEVSSNWHRLGEGHEAMHTYSVGTINRPFETGASRTFPLTLSTQPLGWQAAATLVDGREAMIVPEAIGTETLFDGYVTHYRLSPDEPRPLAVLPTREVTMTFRLPEGLEPPENWRLWPIVRRPHPVAEGATFPPGTEFAEGADGPQFDVLRGELATRDVGLTTERLGQPMTFTLPVGEVTVSLTPQLEPVTTRTFTINETTDAIEWELPREVVTQ